MCRGLHIAWSAGEQGFCTQLHAAKEEVRRPFSEKTGLILSWVSDLERQQDAAQIFAGEEDRRYRSSPSSPGSPSASIPLCCKLPEKKATKASLKTLLQKPEPACRNRTQEDGPSGLLVAKGEETQRTPGCSCWRRNPSPESEKRIAARFCASLTVRPENETHQAAHKVLRQNPIEGEDL
ncbi:hypothetical protein AAC387_Pa08g0918 [Persea americana]